MGLVTALTHTGDDAAVGVSGVDAGTLSAFGVIEISGMLVTVTLLYVLAYANILEGAGVDPKWKNQIFALAIPLILTFLGIVVFHSLETLELIEPPEGP